MKEYMHLALTTCGYRLLSTTSFVGMGDLFSEHAFKWVAFPPEMVRASEVICRLMDDVIDHKFEQKRGRVVSAVEYYVKEHTDVTEEEAEEELRARVFDVWKDITEECLRPTPMPLLSGILNLARAMDVLYKDKDNYSHAGTGLKGFVKCMHDVIRRFCNML